MNLVFYDLEIQKCIPPKGGRPPDGLRYCNGWNDYGGMGISVVCWADLYNPPRCSTVGSPEMDEFMGAAKNADYVIGFNSSSFDDRVLDAHKIPVMTTYDLIVEIRRAAFGSTDWRKTPKGFSYSLDSIGTANGMAKTGTGELAPVLWQKGRLSELAQYCKRDVQITRRLFLLGVSGLLRDPNTAQLLKLDWSMS